MTMGPPQAEEALREALALGAERAIHLSDRVFAVADTLGTSRTLAMAIGRKAPTSSCAGARRSTRRRGRCRRRSPRSSAGRTRPASRRVERSGDGLRLTRETDFGEEVYEADLPLVVSVGLPPGGSDQRRRRRPDRGLAGDRSRRRGLRVRQALRPDRIADPRAGRPRLRGPSVPGSAPRAQRRRPRESASCSRSARPRQPSWEKPDAHRRRAGQRATTAGASASSSTAGTRRVSLELIARSRELAGKLGGRAVALLIGHELDERGARGGADTEPRSCALADDPALAEYHPELWTAVLRRVLVDHLPRALLVPATGRGRDYGPRAAGELELGMTADCVGVDIAKAGRLLQQKPAYGGNIVSVILGRDDSAARDGAPAHVRAARAAGVRCGGPSPRPRLAAGAEGESSSSGHGAGARTTWTRTTSSWASARVSIPNCSDCDQAHGRCRRGHARSMRAGLVDRERARSASSGGPSRRGSTSASGSATTSSTGAAWSRPASSSAIGEETPDEADVSVSGDPARASPDPA